jgi:hypothetical protein
MTPTNGILPASGAATTVTVSFNSNVDSLTSGVVTSGVYLATLTFTDQNTHLTRTSIFTLYVSASLVQNGGFETGDFTDWSLAGSTSLNSVSAVITSAHSGEYSADFGQGGSLAYLSQTIPTSSGQTYLLGFWLANPSSGTPNRFLVNWISNPAGTNTLLSQTNLSSFNWTNKQFVVVSTGTNATVQFAFRDDPQYLCLDDVSLVPVPRPLLQTATPAGGMLALSWAAFPGLKYQVQYKTNLLQTGWVNLGNLITTSNGIGGATITIGTDLQRFYRILGPQ